MRRVHCKECRSPLPLGRVSGRCVACAKQRRREWESRKPSERPCSGCGILGVRPHRTKFCDGCRMVRLRHLSGKKSHLALRNQTKPCTRCGHAFPIRRNPTKKEPRSFCSKACAASHRWELANRNAALSGWFHDWDSQRVECRECRTCGGNIVCHPRSKQWQCGDNNTHAKYNKNCSRECADCGEGWTVDWVRASPRCPSCRAARKLLITKAGKRPASSHRKRCKKYGVPYVEGITRRMVCDRDGWVCKLCGIETLRCVNAKKPDPREGTIDHIIPLSLGIKGHTWDNVQCACRKCNCEIKGARVACDAARAMTAEGVG